MTAATCRHWIGSDATGRVCGADAAGTLPFCSKHLEIQKRRALNDAEKTRAQRERAEAAWLARNAPRLPQLRVHLEQAEAEYARRTSSPVNDRAAYGGAMHASVSRAQSAALSDSNVTRVVELGKLIDRLRADIARITAGRAA
ncbi:hypothetical protein J2X03_003822 [Microbacterium trichothecenolyticum]|uniref:hypothetical protein n=1 Tax=Microbacterium trichothecenolyticum TaxID=69370 RepID=UPI00285FDEFD|nr:hypothetical protein [Microbacterium trichothecenolyticum]MDR7113920.1 hypothetical protein [Microbacterium trichothecenolyticum]